MVSRESFGGFEAGDQNNGNGDKKSLGSWK